MGIFIIEIPLHMQLNILNDKIRLKQTEINHETNPHKRAQLSKQLQKLKLYKQMEEIKIKIQQL